MYRIAYIPTRIRKAATACASGVTFSLKRITIGILYAVSWVIGIIGMIVLLTFKPKI